MAEHKDRLELRLPPEVKDLWERAAALSGQDRSAFVRETVTEYATRVVEAAQTITLTRDQGERFLEALEMPGQPDPRLREAARKLDTLGIK